MTDEAWDGAAKASDVTDKLVTRKRETHRPTNQDIFDMELSSRKNGSQQRLCYKGRYTNVILLVWMDIHL